MSEETIQIEVFRYLPDQARSRYSIVAGVVFFGEYIDESCVNRASGTRVIPSWASPGAAWAEVSTPVRIRNNVDLPVIGKPNRPIFMLSSASGLAG